MRRGELVAVACAGGAMLLTMVFFGGWLSRFELIRLRLISLATLPRYGLMDGYQYVYCLPPAGGRIRSQGNYYCLPPAGGRIRSPRLN
jgi:hypothetical protein